MINKDTLPDLKVEENWPVNSIITQKLKYFGHIKNSSAAVRLMEDMVPGRKGWGWSAQRWTQGMKVTLCMKEDENWKEIENHFTTGVTCHMFISFGTVNNCPFSFLIKQLSF